MRKDWEMSSNYRDFAPAAWTNHWAALPNSVRALYATVQRVTPEMKVRLTPRSKWARLFQWLGLRKPQWTGISQTVTTEIEIQAWGQLGEMRAASVATAYHMYNHEMRTGWTFLSWRAVMEDGTERRGAAPEDFSVEAYGPHGSHHGGGNWGN